MASSKTATSSLAAILSTLLAVMHSTSVHHSRIATEICDPSNNPAGYEDYDITIPDEMAPNNVVKVRAECEKADDMLAKDRRPSGFAKCTATVGDVLITATPGRSASFIGASTSMHALYCYSAKAPEIGDTFAKQTCAASKSQGIGIAGIRIGDTANQLEIVFTCNKQRDQFVECRPQGQDAYVRIWSTNPLYFGGKSGNLYSMKCVPLNEPHIDVHYAKDICNSDDKMDSIEGIAVFFECAPNAEKFLQCIPEQNIKANGVAATKLGNAQRFTHQIKGIISRQQKYEIKCQDIDKPVIRKV